jgi:hypothetical protein
MTDVLHRGLHVEPLTIGLFCLPSYSLAMSIFRKQKIHDDEYEDFSMTMQRKTALTVEAVYYCTYS